MGGIERFENACVYHMIPPAHESLPLCWHCCEQITDKASLVPLPRTYDTTERVYHVYGATCSPGCAMAYILEHTSFDRGQHINVLVKMLREVYGVEAPVITAPPRAAMQKFGGHFDAKAQSKAYCTLVQPPFVSYCMIAEERMAEAPVVLPSLSQEIEDADTLDEPHPPALYSEFLKEMDDSEAEPQPPEKKPRVGPRVGPMSRFIVK